MIANFDDMFIHKQTLDTFSRVTEARNAKVRPSKSPNFDLSFFSGWPWETGTKKNMYNHERMN